ncbi:hypothetical protein [Pediococcus acidilactici]|uniref:hypothetical protein n=1 Tax=Pediococcus acidilactici TaxID=1254 RepID=UPI001BD4AB07|nr:hypothetical protein [Pediococcus acidilactici]MBS9400081.1 hypothetical protein [Pediococcus acidilactici]
MDDVNDILYKLEMLRSLNISIGDYSEWMDQVNYKDYRDRIDGLCLVSKDLIDEIKHMINK